MQSADFLFVDFKISSSEMSNLLPPPWPLTVPSFPPAFTLFYLEDLLIVCRQSCHPFKRLWPVARLLRSQPNLVLISSVTLNKWFNFPVSIYRTYKMELLLVPSEEFVTYHNDSKLSSASALTLSQRMSVLATTTEPRCWHLIARHGHRAVDKGKSPESC